MSTPTASVVGFALTELLNFRLPLSGTGAGWRFHGADMTGAVGSPLPSVEDDDVLARRISGL